MTAVDSAMTFSRFESTIFTDSITAAISAWYDFDVISLTTFTSNAPSMPLAENLMTAMINSISASLLQHLCERKNIHKREKYVLLVGESEQVSLPDDRNDALEHSVPEEVVSNHNRAAAGIWTYVSERYTDNDWI
jgi:hypothetical protein